MEVNLLSNLGSILGIGGVVLGILFLIFRDIIRGKFFPELTKEQAHETINRIILVTGIVAIFGLSLWAFIQLKGSSPKHEKIDPINSSDPSPAKKMLTVRLVIDNHLRNGEIFVDGKQVLSTPDAIIKTIKVVGFMNHEIKVATEKDSCTKSGYFDTDNETILINCK